MYLEIYWYSTRYPQAVAQQRYMQQTAAAAVVRCVLVLSHYKHVQQLVAVRTNYSHAAANPRCLRVLRQCGNFAYAHVHVTVGTRPKKGTG